MHNSPRRRRRHWAPGIEFLEAKALLSAVAVAFTQVSDPADTLDKATDLGTFDTASTTGTIDRNGADVDWFAFTLDTPSQVTLTGFSSTFSLYNKATGTTLDPLSEVGARQLEQFTSDLNAVSVTRDLAAGTYYVAVSGAGNSYFHPLLANSGVPGAGGAYSLEISATALDVSGSTDPLPLSADASALGVWIGLSGALDFAPLVQITDADGVNIPVARVQEALNGTELQVIPGAPLAPGNYRAQVRDVSGDVRLSVTFTVSEVDAAEGAQGNDTPATAIDLGRIEDVGVVQLTGVIGDDLNYLLSTNDRALFAGNDVDLFHFQIDSDTPVGFEADLFARRISSALNGGLSLYREDPRTGSLVLIAGRDNSFNRTLATDGSTPLYHDSVITVALTSGSYYLAVSQGMNTASPAEGQDPATNHSIYVPTIAHSGVAGVNTGRFVLNVSVAPLGNSPEVLSTSIIANSELPSAPSEFSVRFNEFMKLAEPANAAFSQFSQSSLDGVFITDILGRKYFPRLLGFDQSTFVAQFQMAERLPQGRYELHLSGERGVTNLAGVPVAGNSSNGDYVVRFNVARNAVGTLGNPLLWTHDPQTDISGAVQQLGTIFPQEMQAGVAIVRLPGVLSNQGDTSDEYRFRILQTRQFRLHIDGLALPEGVGLTLIDQSGHAVEAYSPDNGQTLLAFLRPGEYTLRVGNWPSSATRRLNYRIDMNMLGQGGDATPLSTGPAPAVGLKLVGLPSTFPGGGGTGSGGAGNGGSGSVGGGQSNGSGSGSTGGETAGLGGSVRTTNSYLSLRDALSQSSVGTLTDGVNIAVIPTVNSTTNGSGSLRVQRAGGLRSSLRDQLSLSGLSDLADGPVGRAGNRSGLNYAGLTGRRLSDQVRDALAARPEGVSNRPAVAKTTETAPTPAENFVPIDVSPNPNVVTTEEPAATDDNNSSETSQLPVDTKSTGNAVSFTDAPRVSEDDLETGSAVLIVESRAATDTVFAAGLGLLLSQLSVSGEQKSMPLTRLDRAVPRPSLRRFIHSKFKRQEDSAS